MRAETAHRVTLYVLHPLTLHRVFLTLAIANNDIRFTVLCISPVETDLTAIIRHGIARGVVCQGDLFR